ncbi:hypothetical protein [uncultured Methanoregula sp.]|uniref:hypothetical protein n=1 Tax=uncultured Methanoregula sp. TaxID=1005933 RepID=UPI002AAA9A64|nr:hypothetical protein [uncultured Methanoregula sp.]
MTDWIPVWVLIPCGILFIGLYASGLFFLLKKITKTIPVYVPPLLAGLTAVTYAVLAPSGPAPDYFVVPMLFLMLTFVIMAVLGAFSFFEGKDPGARPWVAVALVSYVAVLLLGVFFLGGSVEARVGQPAPGFSYRFPLLGLVMDGITWLLNLSSFAYFPPWNSILLMIGLYIEVFLCSAVIFYVMTGGKKSAAKP